MEFYPAGIPVPEEKRTGRLYLRPLRATDVELDCDEPAGNTVPGMCLYRALVA